MMDKISLKKEYEKYITFDEPIPYWSVSIKKENQNENNCLLFYPVMIRDMYEFYRYCGCLLTDHTSELDKSLPFDEAMKILSMNCYEYLFWKTFYDPNSQDFYIYAFSILLSICLKDTYFKDIVFDKSSNACFLDIFDRRDNNGKPAFMINDIFYNYEDFDNLKEIIAYQNELELPDIEKDKRFRDAVEKARKARNRILGNGGKMGDLEDQLICLSLGYGLPYENVGNVSMRKFNKMIDRMNKKLHYETYLLMSAWVEFKDKSMLKHWMLSDEKDKYSDVVMDTDEVNSKISGGDRPQPN